MTINTDLFVTTNDLQQYLVDKDSGNPLSAGVITLYKDSARTTLKNWYYQSGTAGNYSYIALPNPLTLSSVGTITDINGNDTLPFYFPYSEADNATSEPYYITVDNSDGERQSVRQNFPFIRTSSSNNDVPTYKNYIVNNNWWRQSFTATSAAGINSFDLTDVTDVVIAPSSHDGFSMPDWHFMKSATGAEDTLTFKTFAPGNSVLTGDITPEYYINHKCTSVGTETTKYYQVPICLHLRNLDSVTATFTIQAQNVGGSVSNLLYLYVYQFAGTGASSPAPVLQKTFTLTSGWKKHTAKFTFPSASTLNLSTTQDDAFYLQIALPAGTPCDINFTLPSLYLSDVSPTNNFSTYDQVDSIIDSPRTGDMRTTINFFGSPISPGTSSQSGWVAANGGSIGPNGSAAQLQVGTWPLYNLLWSSQLNQWAPVGGGRGVSAIADWNAGKYISLTNNLGRVLAGLNPNFPAATTITGNTGVSNFEFTVTGGATNMDTGSPVQLTGITGLSGFAINTVYYVIYVSATKIYLANTLELAFAGSATNMLTSGTATIQTAIGLQLGESTTSEVPNHVHNFTGSSSAHYLEDVGGSSSPFSVSQPGGSPWDTSAVTVTGTTDNNTGGVADISLFQPTTYVNVFLKL